MGGGGLELASCEWLGCESCTSMILGSLECSSLDVPVARVGIVLLVPRAVTLVDFRSVLTSGSSSALARTAPWPVTIYSCITLCALNTPPLTIAAAIVPASSARGRDPADGAAGLPGVTSAATLACACLASCHRFRDLWMEVTVLA